VIRELTALFSVPFVFIYMALIVKKKIYAYGGIFIILAIFLSFTYAKRAFFIRLIEENIYWFPGSMVLWTIYLIFVTLFLAFIVHVYQEEKNGKYKTTTREDFIKILKPNMANLVFWVCIILINLIAGII